MASTRRCTRTPSAEARIIGNLPVHFVPGAPAEAGFAHGRQLRELLQPPFVEAYLDRLEEVIRFTRPDLREQSLRWLESLPAQYQEEIDGMGAGAGVETIVAAEFLYADIARPSGTDRDGDEQDARAPLTCADDAFAAIDGPMCSAVIAQLDDDATWIGRNCDWLVPTLMRGTAAVVHETPHRIPVMAFGIRGDIDVDTGINAEGLWMHLHTLQAQDDPPPDRTCISWLFWAREATETCATLDELERFIETTGRDRGVFVIAGEGKTNRAAIFECTRGVHTRHDLGATRAACVTNHTLSRAHDERRSAGRIGGTVGRYHALRDRLDAHEPRRGPDDLIGMLAAPDVEMHTPRWLRTIYSAVVSPRDARVWFAAGHPDGTPAASGGRWTELVPPWARRSA